MAWQKISNIKGDPGPQGPPGTDAPQVIAALVGAGKDQDVTGSGPQTINLPYGGVTQVTLTGDMTLTIKSADRMSVGLFVTTNGHTLTITNFPSSVTSDGLVTMTLIGASWYGGAGAASVRDLTPAAVTFSDDTMNGGGTYTVPASNGIAYYNGSQVLSAGTYPVTGSTSATVVTITAQVTNANTSEIAAAATSSWSHSFPASNVVTIGTASFAKVTDGTAISSLTLSNGSKFAQDGTYATVKGGMITANGAAGSDTIRVAVTPFAKMRVKIDYAFTALNVNTYLDLSVGANSDVQSVMGFRLRNGSLLNITNGNYTTTTTPADVTSVTNIPMSGTAIFTMDMTTETGTLQINGSTVATLVGNQSSAWKASAKAGGPVIALGNWDGASVGFSDLTVQALTS